MASFALFHGLGFAFKKADDTDSPSDVDAVALTGFAGADASLWRTLVGTSIQERAVAAGVFAKTTAIALLVMAAVVCGHAFFLHGAIEPGHMSGLAVGTVLLGVLVSTVLLLQRRLQERTALLGLTSDMVHGFSMLHRPDGEILHASPSCGRFTGYSVREFLVKPGRIHDLIHPEDRASWLACEERLAGGLRAAPIRIRLVSREGHEGWFRVERDMVVDGQGNPLALRSRFEDISVRVASELAMDEAHAQARVGEAAKTRFLANMNHEMRTPLNSIIGFSDILANEILGPTGRPEYREYARDINTSGRNLLDRVTQILELAKLESGAVDLRETSMNVPLVIASCQRLLSDVARAGGVTLGLESEPGLPSLFADDRRVRDMLLRLLGNAIKFTPAGGHVALTAHVDAKGGIVLSVVDTGIGIATKDLPRVMAAFEQADGSITRRYEGVGLGLPLCRRVAELHGGTLTVRSEPERGTAVTIRFPESRTLRT